VSARLHRYAKHCRQVSVYRGIGFQPMNEGAAVPPTAVLSGFSRSNLPHDFRQYRVHLEQ
jgi:hypothetical protein